MCNKEHNCLYKHNFLYNTSTQNVTFKRKGGWLATLSTPLDQPLYGEYLAILIIQ